MSVAEIIQKQNSDKNNIKSNKQKQSGFISKGAIYLIQDVDTGSQVGKSFFNSSVGFNFGNIPIQPKLKISQPNDIFEREADRLSEQIMEMSSVSYEDNVGVLDTNNSQNNIHRKCSSCQLNDNKKEKELKISRKPQSSHSNLQTSDKITNQINSSTGRPLDSSTKDFMKSRFGHDFSSVRIHDDSKSRELSESVNARAFTVGHDIFLGRNEFVSDKKLLAHELVHVVQQRVSNTLTDIHNQVIQRRIRISTVENVSDPRQDAMPRLLNLYVD